MIHFDFIVSDEEGELLFDLVTAGQNEAQDNANGFGEDVDSNTRNPGRMLWWKEYAKSLKDLKDKMQNSREPTL